MKRVLYITALLAVFSPSARAEAFDSAVNQIMSGLINISAQNRGYEARIAALEAENSLPGAEASFAYKWPQQRSAQNRWEVEVSQSFDWPGAYGARKRAASELRRLKEISAQTAEEALRYEVESTLLHLIEARQRRRLLSEAVNNMEEIVGKSQTLLESGQITVIDYHKAEFELLGLREKLTQAEVDCERFRALAGFGQVLPAAVDSLTDFPERLSPVPMMTSEMIEQRAEAISGSMGEQIERMKRFPSFSVGYLHDFEEGVHFNGLSVGISLPAYGSGKSATAARLEVETAEMKLAEYQAARNAELDAMKAEAGRLDRLIGEYDKVLTSNDFLRLLRKSYDGGQIALTQYLLDQNWYLTAKTDYLNLCLRRALLR